jgi:hypothetical protein
MDFDIIFDKNSINIKNKPLSLEFWTPLEEPELRKNERDAILYKENVVESMHIARPAFLHSTVSGEITFTKTENLDYYIVAAKLKKSPYLLIYGDFKKSSKMNSFLSEDFNPKKTESFYFDNFFSPGYGLLRPKYFLFEKVELKSIPNTMVIFKNVFLS